MEEAENNEREKESAKRREKQEIAAKEKIKAVKRLMKSQATIDQVKKMYFQRPYANLSVGSCVA